MAILNILPQSPPQRITVNDINDPSVPGIYQTYLRITIQEPQVASVNVQAGVQGPPGSGIQGERGIQGIQGERGIQGIQGIRGERGPTGSGVSSISFSDGSSSFLIDENQSVVQILGGNGTTVSVNDTDNTITISNDLVGHTHTSSSITNFNEAVDDRVDELLIAGNNISLNYQDADFNSLTIAVTGLEVGSDIQAYNSSLQTISDLSLSPGKLIYVNNDSTFELITLSNSSKNLLNDSTTQDQRNTLGLGTIATYDATDFAMLVGGNYFTGNQSFGDGSLTRFSASLKGVGTATYNITQSDNGKIIVINYDVSSVSVTLDASLDVGFNCLVAQIGDGQVRFDENDIQNRYNHNKLVGQYSIATLVKISDSPSVVILSGDTTDANSGP